MRDLRLLYLLAHDDNEAVDVLDMLMGLLNIMAGIGFLLSMDMYESAPAWHTLSEHVSPLALGIYLVLLGLCRWWCIEHCVLRFYTRTILSCISAITWCYFIVTLLANSGSVILPMLCLGLMGPCMVIMLRTQRLTRRKYGRLGWHFNKPELVQRAAEYEKEARCP